MVEEAEGNRDGLDSVNVAGWVAALAAFSISRVPLRFEIRHRLFACRDGAEAEASLVKKRAAVVGGRLRPSLRPKGWEFSRIAFLPRAKTSVCTVADTRTRQAEIASVMLASAPSLATAA